MNRLLTLFPAILLLHASLGYFPPAHADNDLESRVQAEANEYIEKIERLRGQALFHAADLLTGTGLTNPELYAVVENKTRQLLEEHKLSGGDKIVIKELVVVSRALASMDPKSRELLQQIQEESPSKSMKRRAKNIMARVDWYVKRNNLMQKTDYYQPDQDLMTHRYLNLIESEDFSMRRWAAQELRRRGGAEPVVYKKIAEYIDANKYKGGNRHEIDAMAWFCRILREFDRLNYADLLNSVSSDQDVHAKIRKYARL